MLIVRWNARHVAVGFSLALGVMGAPGDARAGSAQPAARHPAVFFALPDGEVQEPGATRAEWNYDFLRGNRLNRVFNASQTVIGTRRNRRKTHLVTWRVHHGLIDRMQAEAEVVYQAYRQHTHSEGDVQDRNDDGDFERLFLGASYQAARESTAWPAVRLRGGLLLPRRAETEGIGQETGVDLLGVTSKRVGRVRLSSSVGFAMTFDNHDHPADPILDSDATLPPISKPHDLRALTYGLGAAVPLTDRWQANVELDGKLFDTIQLNRRVHESELTLTPGVIYTRDHGRWRSWLGLGAHLGLTHDTDHVGVAVRMGADF